MKKQPIKLTHDKSADVLYIVFGESQPSYSEDIGDGIYARFSFLDDHLTGITILDYSSRSKSELVTLISSENIITDDINELYSLL